MASFVYAVWSITNVASVHCSVRPEISPCTCEPIVDHNYVELSCEKVDSFHLIVDALSNKFEPNVNISLKISHSQLDDLEMRSFTDMNFNVVKLRMQWNSLRSIPELPFRGLSNLEFLSVGDNELEEIPKHMLNHMPLVKTLDIGRCRLRAILQDDLKGIQLVTYLFLPSNNISRLEKGAFPPSLVTLHLGRNQIESLNGTLRDLNNLESLFINMNNISSLDDELPESNRLRLLLAHNNRLDHLPETMRYLDKLEQLHLQNNYLRSLDGIFKNAKNMIQFYAFNNQLEYLAADEFQSSDMLDEFDLSMNRLRSLNHSLLPMTHLCAANFSFNEITEFSMHEIRGLQYLKNLDLSHNRIAKLTGRQDNNIVQDSFLIQFNLDHNELTSLDGALIGLNSLRILSLSHNKIERIQPDDFVGLTKLEILELSHNNLLTLREMEKTSLPNLKILKVAYNKLTKLERDFHGLPKLCTANLTNNQITSISPALVSKTCCSNHNVPVNLEMFLEGNPIMCDDRLSELCPLMLNLKVRIRGKSACFDSDQEVCDVLPMLLRPAILPRDIPIVIQHQVNQAPNAKPIVKVIVESPILLNNKMQEKFLPPLISPLILAKPPPAMQLAAPVAATTLPPTTTTTTQTAVTTPAPMTTSTTVAPPVTSTAATTTTTTATSPTPPPPPPASGQDGPKAAEEIGDGLATPSGGARNETASMAPHQKDPAMPPQPIIHALLSGHAGGAGGNGAELSATAAKEQVTPPSPPPLVMHIDAGTQTNDDDDEGRAREPGPLEKDEAPSDVVAVAGESANAVVNHTDSPGQPGPSGPVGQSADIEVQLSPQHADEGGDGPAAKAAQPEYATMEYIPNFGEFIGGEGGGAVDGKKPPNVLVEDSKTNSVLLADLDTAQQSLLIPAEPPENP